MSAALVARIEARIIAAEQALSRTEMLRARGLLRDLDAALVARRRAEIEDDLARLWAHRRALLRSGVADPTTEQEAA